MGGFVWSKFRGDSSGTLDLPRFVRGCWCGRCYVNRGGARVPITIGSGKLHFPARPAIDEFLRRLTRYGAILLSGEFAAAPIATLPWRFSNDSLENFVLGGR